MSGIPLHQFYEILEMLYCKSVVFLFQVFNCMRIIKNGLSNLLKPFFNLICGAEGRNRQFANDLYKLLNNM